MSDEHEGSPCIATGYDALPLRSLCGRTIGESELVWPSVEMVEIVEASASYCAACLAVARGQRASHRPRANSYTDLPT